jgi:GNAT superfamily N-acetyltransferase
LIKIRHADAGEYEILNDIAVSSEASFGYGEQYVQIFKSIYKVTEKSISSNPTYVLQEGCNINGFYSLHIENRDASLKYLFIEPASIGMGFGKALWKHMVYTCKGLEVEKVIIAANPKIKDFYIKMGAEMIDETELLIIGGVRMQRLIYKIK